jgi:hypothetical protein
MFQRYARGDFVTADAQNKLIREVERLGNITVDYPLEVLSGQSGIHIRSIESSFLARLTGVSESSPYWYSWVESYSKGDGTFADLLGGRQSAGGNASTPGANIIGPAYNVASPGDTSNGPATGDGGAIVWLTPGNSFGSAPTPGDPWGTGEYLFWHHSGTGGGSSGSGGSEGSGSEGSGSSGSGSYPVGEDCTFSLCVPYISDIEIIDGQLIKHVNYLGWTSSGFLICEGCSGSSGSGSSGSGSGSGESGSGESGSSGGTAVVCEIPPYCELPNLLYMRVDNADTECPCLDGLVITLTYDIVSGDWLYSGTLCGTTVDIELTFTCSSSGQISITAEGMTHIGTNSGSCNPVSITFPNQITSISACTGLLDISISETP